MSEATTKTIKRYQNRKLYDTHQSCYVTLEEISQMIRNGDDLQVIDNNSKNDITKNTLIQLLYEAERKNPDPIPVGLLKEIIAKGHGSFSGYVRRHMTGEVERFERESGSAAARLATSSAPTDSPVTQ